MLARAQHSPSFLLLHTAPHPTPSPPGVIQHRTFLSSLQEMCPVFNLGRGPVCCRVNMISAQNTCTRGSTISLVPPFNEGACKKVSS